MCYVEIPFGYIGKWILDFYKINSVEKLMEYKDKNTLTKRISAEVKAALQQNKTRVSNEASLDTCCS